MLENLLIGVAGSLVASLVFLAALFRLRPKIIFSPFIANQSKESDIMYGFKIINKSRFPLTQVQFQLTLISPKSVPNGVVLRNELIPLTKDYIFEVGAYSKNDKDAHYAVRVGTTTDISSICINEGQYLYFTVSAQHSLSGFSRVFTKFYYPLSDVKKGHHEFGLGLDVR